MSRKQAISHGVSPRAIARRVSSGQWRSLLGCLVMCDSPLGPDWRDAWALGLRLGPTAVVSGPTALRIQRHPVPDSLILTHVGVNAHLTLPGVRLLRDTVPRATLEGPGFLLARPPDALIDTLLAVSEQRARELLDHALQLRWIAHDDWAELVEPRTGCGRTGSARLGRLGRRIRTGAHSEGERVLHRILQRGGVRGWVANYPVADCRGRVLAVADVAFPELKLCVEVDGRAAHSGREQFERDRERQNVLVLEGWMVLRFTWAQLVNEPEAVLAQIRAAIAARAAGVV